MTRSAKPSFTRSSGNVFEDLQVTEPSEALAKSELAAIIAEALRARRLTQTAAAKVLGVDQPKVSELLRGRLTRFSTERLLLFLLRLGRDVDIVVSGGAARPATRPGRLHVRAGAPRQGKGVPSPAYSSAQ
jgi:predicted XRE-type DNA-binding protein